MQPNFRTGKTDLQHRLGDETDIKPVDFNFTSQEGREEEALDVQPLFDPNPPPTAYSDFKPKIGLVSTSGSDVEELRRCYPQLHLTIVEAGGFSTSDDLGTVSALSRCATKFLTLRMPLLSQLLRHRYIRLNGGMTAVKALLDAWLAVPGSTAAVSRRRLPFGGIKRNTSIEKKRQSRYPD